MQNSLSYKVNKYRIREQNAASGSQRAIYARKLKHYLKKLEMIGGAPDIIINSIESLAGLSEGSVADVAALIREIAAGITDINNFLEKPGDGQWNNNQNMDKIIRYLDDITTAVLALQKDEPAPPEPAASGDSEAVQIFKQIFDGVDDSIDIRSNTDIRLKLNKTGLGAVAKKLKNDEVLTMEKLYTGKNKNTPKKTIDSILITLKEILKLLADETGKYGLNKNNDRELKYYIPALVIMNSAVGAPNTITPGDVFLGREGGRIGKLN